MRRVGAKGMDAKRKAVLERIAGLERALVKGKEYLESGKHAGWVGFRPLFTDKVREGKEMPPHREWVRNVFLSRLERALARAERVLERMGEGGMEGLGQKSDT